MVIKQKLNDKDILALNLYIFKQNKKLTYNMILIGIFSFVAAIFSFIKENYGLGILFVVVGVIGIGVLPILYKGIIKKNVSKKVKDVLWEINVTFEGDKIYYAFSHENLNNIDPYEFKQIMYVQEYKKYIFIKIDAQTILFINKEYVEDLEKLHNLFEEKLILDSRYFVNLKKDY